MPTVALKPGPELDAAVAKACGIACVMKDCGRIRCVRKGEAYELAEASTFGLPYFDVYGDFFEPSTDLNAAFAAAEKCIAESGKDVIGRAWSHSLLESYYLQKHGDSWGIWEHNWGDEQEPRWFGATPALAICAAILALKGTA